MQNESNKDEGFFQAKRICYRLENKTQDLVRFQNIFEAVILIAIKIFYYSIGYVLCVSATRWLALYRFDDGRKALR